MRKSFNGLAAIASAIVARGLESGALFVFTNNRRNRLKILLLFRQEARRPDGSLPARPPHAPANHDRRRDHRHTPASIASVRRRKSNAA